MKTLSKTQLEHCPPKLPVVVIGGGISGAGVFRDLSLHKIPCLLIDKHDFTSQTSQSSSKMLHGGIRYLENFDFQLVWEALHEKDLWLKLTPHLTYPAQFYLPVYKDSLRPLWMVKIGLFIYDLLSQFKNIPNKVTSTKETLEAFPDLKKAGLTGAGVYSDAVMDDAKITLECIYDGLLEKGSYACNHTSLTALEIEEDHYKLTLKDELTGTTRRIEAEHLIFTTGPFTDKLMSELECFKWEPKLSLSRGSHIWLTSERLPLKSPMVLTPKDGRVIFVIPQAGNRVLVGTTEVAGEAGFNQAPSQEEIEYLIQNLNEFFPELKIGLDDIVSSFAGSRPLVREPGGSGLGKVARHHKIYQPHYKTWVLLGGKYTTFRIMARDVVSLFMRQAGLAYNSNLSEKGLRQPSLTGSWTPATPPSIETIKKIIESEYPKTWEDLFHRRLGIIDPKQKKELKERLQEVPEINALLK